jgi:hypothetical protein
MRPDIAPHLRLRSFFLLLVLIVGLLPACQGKVREPGRSIDDALLLALAAHEQLDLDSASTAMRAGGPMRVLASPAAKPRNPHQELVSWYTDMAMELEGEQDPMYDYVVGKLEEHSRLADDLDAARARRARSGRGFQRFVRGLARAPVNVARGTGRLLKGMLRVTGTVLAVAIEQVPRLARDYVQKKLRELRDLAQGKIDLTWDKVAAKLGAPFAVWLRSRVDPAFVRLRDRLTRRLLGERRKPETVAATRPSVSQDQPVYGNWEVELVTDDETCWAGFTWVDYWVNLPATDFDGDDCQRAGDSTHHVDFFFPAEQSLPLTFELDSGRLVGGFDVRSFDNPVEWERVEGGLSVEIENGWVRPRADTQGWEFGGELVVSARGIVSLECWFNPADPQVPGFFHWISDDKQIVARTEFSGSTYQFVPAAGEVPGRVTPGGTISLLVGTPYEGDFPPAPMLYASCEDQRLPSEFPPPGATAP